MFANTPKQTVALITAYWTAAIADFLVAGLVLIPERMGVGAYVYPMGLMSAVAFSWAVMLVVAARRPWERRWMLPSTMLVVGLIGCVALHAGVARLIPMPRAIGTVIASLLVLGVLLYGYRQQRPG